jgi:hypothetical protein
MSMELFSGPRAAIPRVSSLSFPPFKPLLVYACHVGERQGRVGRRLARVAVGETGAHANFFMDFDFGVGVFRREQIVRPIGHRGDARGNGFGKR